MPEEDIRNCGLKLRETYAASRVAEKMLDAFRSLLCKRGFNYRRDKSREGLVVSSLPLTYLGTIGHADKDDFSMS